MEGSTLRKVAQIVSTTYPTTIRKTFSWAVTFKNTKTGEEVCAGVFASEFIKARTKALGHLVEKLGGSSDRFVYSSYSRVG